VNRERSPRHAGRVGSAAVRFAHRSYASPPSTPRSAKRGGPLTKENDGNTDTEMLNHWCHSAVRQRISVCPNLTVSFCREATRRECSEMAPNQKSREEWSTDVTTRESVCGIAMESAPTRV